MNRSVLIVICDFLLLSLLTFSTDINRIADENTRPPLNAVVATNELADAGKDLAAVMKLALEEQRKGYEQLQQQLAAAREAVTRQQAQLNAREQEYQQLQQQYATARTNLAGLNRQLQENSAESQQKLAAIEAEAQRQSELVAALRQQLEQLSSSNLVVQTEQQQLAGRLQLAEAEKNAAAERAALMQEVARAERAENIKLAEGFKTLATNSSQLTQEIRENRALAPNTIFSEFVSNRITMSILASRSGFLGLNSSKNKETKTVLVTDGNYTFALCHVQDTPLAFGELGTDWDALTGTLAGKAAPVSIHSLSFHQTDPRVVMVLVSSADVRQLGKEVYCISSDPYKFQDAVLVGADGGYYGECDFQIDLRTPKYVKLDRSLVRGLFGKFNPSRGDLVFSRSGELLGIMVNNTYCLVIHSFTPVVTLQFGPDVRNEHVGSKLSQLYFDIFQMPMRLQ